MDRLDRGFIATIIVQAVMPLENAAVYMELASWARTGMVRYMPMVLYCIAGSIILVVGIGSYLPWVRRRTPRFRAVVWSWAVLEACNAGVVIAMAAVWRKYYPGLLSSMLMVAALANLADAMVASRRMGSATAAQG